MKTDFEKYTYRVEWSEEDNTHIARCLEFPSLQAHGKTAIQALKEIEKLHQLIEEMDKTIQVEQQKAKHMEELAQNSDKEVENIKAENQEAFEEAEKCR